MLDAIIEEIVEEVRQRLEKIVRQPFETCEEKLYAIDQMKAVTDI